MTDILLPKIITHLGKSLKTSHYLDIPKEVCDHLREKYYEKPTKKEVNICLENIAKGGIVVYPLIKYYFRDLMSKVRLKSTKWSIEEVLQCDDLIKYFYSRLSSNKKVYPPNKELIKNFETSLRISGGRVTMNPSNYPIKSADYIINKYNVNNNYYDFSCGWGIRLLSSLKANVNYFGTDPNPILVKRLKELFYNYNKVNNTNAFSSIKCQGSEKFIKKWKEKMGLVFSSPPYYDLEDYIVGDQSIYENKQIKTYKNWTETFIIPTINNSYNYLVKGGYLLINIKNLIGYPMYTDIFSILEKDKRFNFIGEEKLSITKRPSVKKNLDTDEKIMVFQKA